MSDYKEIPCRRCGRVWKWAFDKKSEPYCPKGYGCEAATSEELFDAIMKRLDGIEKKIEKLETPPPVFPTTPFPTYLGTPNTCSKCGMVWEGVMSYYCSHNDCPIQLRVTSQTYNASHITGDFNVESLDPDERTWYYDGDGTKRVKE